MNPQGQGGPSIRAATACLQVSNQGVCAQTDGFTSMCAIFVRWPGGKKRARSVQKGKLGASMIPEEGSFAVALAQRIAVMTAASALTGAALLTGVAEATPAPPQRHAA